MVVLKYCTFYTEQLKVHGHYFACFSKSSSVRNLQMVVKIHCKEFVI